MAADAKGTDLKSAYRRIMDDHFPDRMEISFIGPEGTQTLAYEKVTWVIDGEEKGLRYGENPGQEAALYRLAAGSLVLGNVATIKPGRYLASNAELLQSGKHPGKINITDVDSALNILRHLADSPCAVIVKHNNPCGAAKAGTLAEAYRRAHLADRLAAFGGAIALNREVDLATAELIVETYAEVVAAPEFAPGVMDRFSRWKNLRVMRIANMARLAEYAVETFIDFKSLVDGGLVLQTGFVPKTRSARDFLPAAASYKGKEYRVVREPTAAEYGDLLFGWLVETGITSNSVIYVKDGATVGIGTGEQDRVGVAEIARDKAYRKLADRISWETFKTPYASLEKQEARVEIDREVARVKGGIAGSVMISDGFFPFRDGVDVGLREGITAIAQPGGSDRDFESIEAVNEAGAAMVFTGQRCFKH
ncbi:MAG: IMP cyclohydrolase [Spirochaetes bacterium]|nr:IMP cyclohydrolase [Spirochaetota bacterium]